MLFPLPGTHHGSVMLGYLTFKCFHLAGQMCCKLAEVSLGTGRAGRGTGQGLNLLHVPGFTRRGWFMQGGSSRAALPSPAETSSALSSSENPQPHSGKMKGEKIDTSGSKPSLGLSA